MALGVLEGEAGVGTEDVVDLVARDEVVGGVAEPVLGEEGCAGGEGGDDAGGELVPVGCREVVADLAEDDEVEVGEGGLVVEGGAGDGYVGQVGAAGGGLDERARRGRSRRRGGCP